MSKKTKKRFLFDVGLFVIAVVTFAIFSQLYSADYQIFITDSYFIRPKSQPFQFILMWFANITVLLFALWLGRKIAMFLWRKGLLFSVVGAFLLVAALFLGYFSLVLKTNIESTRDLVTMGVLVVFIAGIGALMLFSPVFGNKK